MQQREAIKKTVELAEKHGMPELPGSLLGLEHLRYMAEAAQNSEFSESKLGRWLGWAQCAVVAADIGVTLEDMKLLNVELSAD
ncbi:MAG: hypothetical protein ACRC5T_03290 [Cetobacterium sp.]